MTSKAKTGTATALKLVSGLALLGSLLLGFAAAGQSSVSMVLVAGGAFLQGILLWAFADIVESLAHIRVNTEQRD